MKMLSELVIALTKELEEHGDMPIMSTDSYDEQYWGAGGFEVMKAKYWTAAHDPEQGDKYTQLEEGKKYLYFF